MTDEYEAAVEEFDALHKTIAVFIRPNKVDGGYYSSL